MRTYDKPDPVFRYDLDERWWAALQREMGEVRNPGDASLGVAAANAFIAAVDSPPPTTNQLNAIVRAVDCDSLTVARNAAYALMTLAILDPHTRDRIRATWRSLRSQGRWSVLWRCNSRTPEMRELATELISMAFEDRSKNIRQWASTLSHGLQMRQFLPKMRYLASIETDPITKSLYQRDVDLLDKGWSFEANEIGSFAGTMYVAPCGFSVDRSAIEHFGVDRLGILASTAAAHAEPSVFRQFTADLAAGRYEKLGKPAAAQ